MHMTQSTTHDVHRHFLLSVTSRDDDNLNKSKAPNASNVIVFSSVAICKQLVHLSTVSMHASASNAPSIRIIIVIICLNENPSACIDQVSSLAFPARGRALAVKDPMHYAAPYQVTGNGKAQHQAPCHATPCWYLSCFSAAPFPLLRHYTLPPHSFSFHSPIRA